MSPPPLDRFLADPDPVIRIAVTETRGSAPRAAGTVMYVTPRAAWGTIGGGQLEHLAMDTARRMLADGETRADLHLALGPDTGQCCGGHVSMDLTRLAAPDRAADIDSWRNQQDRRPWVVILGAGHVGRALASLLQHLPVRPVLVDQRQDQLDLNRADVETRLSALPEAEIAQAPPASAFVILTHDHGLDFLLTLAALRRGDAAYVGMIGSATKRARFRSWLRDHGDGQDMSALVCPIGGSGSTDKRPEVIAAFVTAEILSHLERAVDHTVHNPEQMVRA